MGEFCACGREVTRRTSAEVTLYADRVGNHITTKRAVFGRRTFVVALITSVTVSMRQPSRWRALFLVAFGLLFAVRRHPALGLWGNLAGVVIAGVAALWLSRLRQRYCLFLSTAGGEVKAIERRERALIAELATALTDAIVMRG